MRKPCNFHLNTLWIARKRVGLGQKTVAQRLGHKTASTISEYETGRIVPNLRTALKLARIPTRSSGDLNYSLQGMLHARRHTSRFFRCAFVPAPGLT